MRLLLAPDSFKGTFSAVEVAEALARGAERAGFEADRCPVADGGEGTLDVLLAALGGERVVERVHDPLGRVVEAAWARLGDGTLAVVEMAQASGLQLVAEDERDAWAASTYGTGELLAAAAASGAAEVLVAVGGSATTDGGRGALEALGGSVPADGGRGALEALGGSVPADGGRGALEALGGNFPARLTVLCDVETPWERAAEVYGPQKGADPDMVRRLTERLDAFAAELPRDPRGVPMTGAAGGLSGGLWAGLGAELVPGAPRVLDVVGFDDRLAEAWAVVAGEGRLDAQSRMGKIVGEIAARARAAGVPAHAVVGQTALTDAEALELGLASVAEAQTLGDIEQAAESLASAQSALREAIALEAEAQRRLLDGDAAGGTARMAAAAERYRASWERAGPRSFGRLIGMLKAALIAGDAADAAEAARYTREQLGADGDSPPSWYALALAAAVRGDDDSAARAAEAMRAGGDAFARTADALAALARRDGRAYAEAVRAIVADFEAREQHLTGVAFADTALMLERLAEARGLAAHPRSELLP